MMNNYKNTLRIYDEVGNLLNESHDTLFIMECLANQLKAKYLGKTQTIKKIVREQLYWAERITVYYSDSKYQFTLEEK